MTDENSDDLTDEEIIEQFRRRNQELALMLPPSNDIYLVLMRQARQAERSKFKKFKQKVADRWIEDDNKLEKLKQAQIPKAEMLEVLAELEHEQWMHWSKATLENLKKMDSDEPDAYLNACFWFEDRWSRNWKPYNELSEETKEFDRIWARKVLEILERKPKSEEKG
jgi:hypothetical protein